jgi:hypothetical protein
MIIGTFWHVDGDNVKHKWGKNTGGTLGYVHDWMEIKRVSNFQLWYSQSKQVQEEEHGDVHPILLLSSGDQKSCKLWETKIVSIG